MIKLSISEISDFQLPKSCFNNKINHKTTRIEGKENKLKSYYEIEQKLTSKENKKIIEKSVFSGKMKNSGLLEIMRTYCN